MKLNMNKHKDMIITECIYQNNKIFFVVINPRSACKMRFSDHLWLPFLGQPQSYVVVFTIIFLTYIKYL